MQIVDADANDIATLTGHEDCWLGVVDGDLTAFGGFRKWNGKLWAFLDVYGNAPAVALVREMKRRIEAQNQPVYVACDEQEHPQAPKLLALLGFTQTENEMLGGMRIWEWPIQ